MDTSLWVFSSHLLDTIHAYEHRPGAASMPAPYRRRQPEATVLHELVQSHRFQLLRQASEHSEHGYPAFIEHTFERYLECGLLEHGFARVRCEQCGFDRLVAFSCKSRGLCPSCSARRMHDVAAHLADRVLPWVPHRQWVASFPRYVRYQLACNPELLGNVLCGFLHIVFSWQRRRARKQGISDGRCGAVTFIQRFGGFVNLNVHFHALVPDGVFVRDAHGMGGERQRPRFIALDPPTDDYAQLWGRRVGHRPEHPARHQ